MLEQLQQQPPDALLALIKLYADDERADKIDLGVGVYREDDGSTPVFRAIKMAEQRLVDEQDSKGYLGPEGNTGFVEALMPYVFGDDFERMDRIAGMQTPGGTGAVRLALSLALHSGVKRVLMGTPSWPNHAQILNDVGLETVTFDHANDDGSADMDALRDAIAGAGPGDAILVHGCCHNPTGVDYSRDEWDELAKLVANKGIFAIVDTAYQGLGAGLEEDSYGMRKMLSTVPEALLCYSCDKNFGLYRDRVGALFMMVEDPADLDKVASNANSLARANWSMPPDHGGAAVCEILTDEAMTAEWLAELTSMRERIQWVRDTLAAADNKVPGLNLGALAQQKGLFVTLKLSKDQIAKMRSDHAVYMAGSGRINVAGLTKGNIEKFIDALADVTG